MGDSFAGLNGEKSRKLFAWHTHIQVNKYIQTYTDTHINRDAETQTWKDGVLGALEAHGLPAENRSTK